MAAQAAATIFAAVGFLAGDIATASNDIVKVPVSVMNVGAGTR